MLYGRTHSGARPQQLPHPDQKLIKSLDFNKKILGLVKTPVIYCYYSVDSAGKWKVTVNKNHFVFLLFTGFLHLIVFAPPIPNIGYAYAMVHT